MSFTYAQFVTSFANILQVETTNADFLDMVPRAIEYATDRIQNDLDLLATHAVANVALVSGTRTATLPTPTGSGNGPIYIPESASVITPASTLPDAGTRNPLQRVSMEYLNYSWPTVTDTGVPVCFALQDYATMTLGPAPDAAYKVEVVGVYRPPTLSDTVTETWITDNLPELFMAAALVFGFGWERDFGGMSNDPQAAVSWEAQYQALMASDKTQELRKFSRSPGWTPMEPSPGANPPRP